nr:hypothetical protein [Candidatus Accumulibacter phosphatis]
MAANRLTLDNLQTNQAKKELTTAEDVLPRVARECYKWLLCPTQDTPTAAKPTVEVFPLNTGGAALGPEIERVCIDNVLVITIWSPIHLRDELKKLYWKAGKSAIGGMAFWEDTLRYLYLPRLKNRQVLEQAIVKGAGSRDFFGTSYGQHEGKFDGFKVGDANVQLDDTLLLIEPDAAKAYEAALPPGPTPPGGGGAGSTSAWAGTETTRTCAARTDTARIRANAQAPRFPRQRRHQRFDGQSAVGSGGGGDHRRARRRPQCGHQDYAGNPSWLSVRRVRSNQTGCHGEREDAGL